MFIIHRPQTFSSLLSQHNSLFPHFDDDIWTMNTPIITRASCRQKLEADKNLEQNNEKENEFGHLELSNNDENYIHLTIDVPGCKPSDLTLEFDPDNEILEILGQRKTKKNGHTILKQFQKRFSLPETLIDNNNLKASVLDGILTIQIAKKNLQNESKAWNVPVVPKEYKKSKEEEEVNMQMDLPGVKADDVTIKFLNQKTGRIQVTGERKQGDKMIKTYKGQFEVNKRKVDTANLKAFISDGVLTIAAPQKKRKIEKKRIIPVDNVLLEALEANTADPTPEVVAAAETSVGKDEDSKDEKKETNKDDKN